MGRVLVAILLTAFFSAAYIETVITEEPVRLIVTDSFVELDHRLPSRNVRVPLHEIERVSTKLVSHRRRGGTYNHVVLTLQLRKSDHVRVRSGGAPRFERAVEDAAEAIRRGLDP